MRLRGNAIERMLRNGQCFLRVHLVVQPLRLRPEAYKQSPPDADVNASHQYRYQKSRAQEP